MAYRAFSRFSFYYFCCFGNQRGRCAYCLLPLLGLCENVLLAVCSFTSQRLLLVAHGQRHISRKGEQKQITKKVIKFPNHSILLTLPILNGKGHLFHSKNLIFYLFGNCTQRSVKRIEPRFRVKCSRDLIVIRSCY